MNPTAARGATPAVAPADGLVRVARQAVAVPREVVGRRAPAVRRDRSIRPAQGAVPIQGRGVASASVDRATNSATIAAGRKTHEIGRGRQAEAPSAARDEASGGQRVQARTAEAARAAPAARQVRAAIGPGIDHPDRVAVAPRFAAVDDPRIGRPTNGPAQRVLRGNRATDGRADDRHTAVPQRALARAGSIRGRALPARRPTVVVSTVRVRIARDPIEAASGGPGRIGPGSGDHRIGHGSLPSVPRRPFGRQFRHPTCWRTTRSSLPDGGLSKRRSSPAGRPIASSSSRNAARRSSGSSSTRPAFGSRWSRSRAGP
jgi:hypothetical protein